MNSGASVLPHSIELEHAILNAPLEWGRNIPGLEPRDFFRDANAFVASAIAEAQRKGLPPEYQVIRQVLRERNQLDAVGEVYLNELARDGVRPSDAALAANLKQLHELARKRQAATLILRYANDPAEVDLERLHRDLEALRIAGSVGIRASFRSPKDLAEAAERVDWLVRGFLARGAITELTGQVKRAGKTTLIAYIAACILDGLPCFGDTAQQSPVVILTEQTTATFREVLRRAGLLHRSGDDLRILSYWDVKGQSWPAIAEMATTEAERIGATLVVVDTLPQFAGIKGDGENSSGDALAALEPLQMMAHQGLAVLDSRHARKSGGEVGEDGRGSSAFTGGVDIVLSLKRPEGNHKPTMRVLEGLSRFDETPARIVIDKRSVRVPDPEIEVWTESFVVLGDTDAVAADEAKEALARHLPGSEDAALPMADLLSLTSIAYATLYRVLKADPTVETTGKGGKKDPLRYYRRLEVGSIQTSNPRTEHEQNRLGGPNGEYFRA